MKIKKNERKGITLVSLVITVIILLILSTIAIQSLTNTGLFEKAKEAKQKTENAQKEEKEILDNYITQINISILKNIDKKNTNPETALPKGAVIIEGDANKGIVIKDSNDNEWVWVEVPKTVFTTATKEDDYKNIEKDLITYAKDYREGKSEEDLNCKDEWYAIDGETLITAETTGLTDEQKILNNGCGLSYEEYNTTYQKMLSSVYTNGGFWISRYEIGDSTATNNQYTPRTINSEINGLAVSKPNQIPYNLVTCAQSQALANGMSTDSNKTSSLLFGIQWDLTCKFLEINSDLAKTDIKSDSTTWGNYKNNSLTLYRGKYNIIPWSSTSRWTSYETNTDNYVTNSQTSNNESYRQLLTTGASKQTNKMNIYDFAGNLWEWTLEYNNSSISYPCISRGGGFDNNSFDCPAARRIGNHIDRNNIFAFGFRSSLY